LLFILWSRRLHDQRGKAFGLYTRVATCFVSRITAHVGRVDLNIVVRRCHNNCSEFSPEVEVSDGKWRNVLVALSRSKTIQCTVCGETGASIVCSKPGCDHSVHYGCGEDTGWRFGKDGKVFFCSSHRKGEFDTSRRVSIAHFVAHMGSDVRCVLCGQGNETEDCDIMRAYIVPGSVAGSNGSSMVALHSFCAKYTNVVALEDDVSEIVRRRVSGSTNLI
jgi:hypothetical protein